MAVSIVNHASMELDLEGIASFIAATIQGLPYYTTEARAREVAKYGTRQLRELCDDFPEGLLVAHEGTQVAGVCLIKPDDGLLWLSWILVAQAYRQRNVGTSLLVAAEDVAKRIGGHKIWCDTQMDNHPSLRFFQRNGFLEIATLTDHWYRQNFKLWEKKIQ